MLTREQILGAPMPKEEVEVEAWGGSVYVRALSGHEAIELAETLGDKGGAALPYLAALLITDENGERMFSEADVEALGKTQAKALQQVVEAGLDFNGFGDVEEVGND